MLIRTKKDRITLHIVRVVSLITILVILNRLERDYAQHIYFKEWKTLCDALECVINESKEED